MKYDNLSKYLDVNNVCMFGYDELDNNGFLIRHGELPFFVTLNGKVVMNPLVKNICDEYKKSLNAPTKDINKKEVVQESKETRVVKPVNTENNPVSIKNTSKSKTEKKENEENEKSSKALDIFSKGLSLVVVGFVCYAFGTLFKGCGHEKPVIAIPKDNGKKQETSAPETTNTSESVTIDDEEITAGEAVADVKAIELELIKYGILEEGKPNYDEILEGARALYVRVNAEELSPEAIKALGFKNLDAIQVIGKSFDITSGLMTDAYQESLNGGNDYIHLSIFCHNDADKKIADELHEIAVESLTTTDKEVAAKNVKIVGDYYRNLSPEEFNYSVGVGQSQDAILHLYAEEIIKMGGKFGVNKKELDSIVDLPGYGNYSYEYRILENKCRFDQSVIPSIKTLI